MFHLPFIWNRLHRSGRRPQKPARCRLVVQALESRLVPSTFNEFPVPGAPEGLHHDQLASQVVGPSITTGPDGNLWFTHFADHAVAQITPDGTVTEFAVPSDVDALYGITTGPDGNLWLGTGHFSPSFPNEQTFILRMTPGGDPTYFRARLDDGGVNANDFIANFYGPTVGSDGNLWYHMGLYTSPNEDLVGRIAPDGTVTNFIIGTPSQGFDGLLSAGGITPGPDGNLWLRFGDGLHGSPPSLREITPDGTLSDPIAATPALGELTTGPDGNIWGLFGNSIERITPDGTVTDFMLPTPTQPLGITAGPDGNVWFTEPDANQIGMITPDGQITEYQVPTPNSLPAGITAGPDGNIWFTELGSGQIGELVLNDGGGARAMNAAAVGAVFAAARPQVGNGVVHTQPPTGAAVDAVFATSSPETIHESAGLPARAEAGGLAHAHAGDGVGTHDLAALTDPLTATL